MNAHQLRTFDDAMPVGTDPAQVTVKPIGTDPAQVSAKPKVSALVSKHRRTASAATSLSRNNTAAGEVEGSQELDSEGLRPRNQTTVDLSVEPIQEWEGYVTSVGRARFSARLIDVTKRKTHETEAAQFLISELSEDNIALLCEGAKFRWVIGTQFSNGRKRSVSELVFRRLPAWTRRELQSAKEEATQLAAERWD